MTMNSKQKSAAPEGCAPPTVSDLEQDPHEAEEYQKFVASMVPHCNCRANNCPCHGVLAGGPCDMIQEEEPWPSYDDEE